MRTALALAFSLAIVGIAHAQEANHGGDETKRSAAPSSALAAKAVSEQRGAVLYDRLCLACHGKKGDGQGPAAPLLWPQARDFSSGIYKWRSTPVGLPPSDEDLRLTIEQGVAGTSMHSFSTVLSREDEDALLTHLKAFAPRKFRREAKVVAALPLAPKEANLARGEALYASLGCIKCHGAQGRGDGPSAKSLKNDKGEPSPPYDLRTQLSRRPRPLGQSVAASIFKSMRTGIGGTAMPSYEGTASSEDLSAVAHYTATLVGAEASPKSQRERGSIAPQIAAIDSKERGMKAGYYPGHGDNAERLLFGEEIKLQGPKPQALTPAESSLDARRCARCHNKQYREWSTSLHAKAGSPGLKAQLLAMERKSSWKSLQSCQRCHNPLAEQSPVLSAAQRSEALGYQKNPHYQPQLRDQGLNCASCHVRKWQRYGPQASTNGTRLSRPGYPLTELAIYERSDFCMPCHQLPSRNALNGKPLLNTYKEWLEGPYMKKGVQCQHCHMPDREHQWKGVHDPETFRQGFELTAIAARGKTGVVSVRAKIKNVGAGHYLPTTPTPAAWIKIALLDKDGNKILGAKSSKRIGRHLVYKRGWNELEDTRIPPGESLELASAWKNGRVSKARSVRVSVFVEPDEYYERFYRRRLAQKSLPAIERKLFEKALKAATESHYVATTQTLILK